MKKRYGIETLLDIVLWVYWAAAVVVVIGLVSIINQTHNLVIWVSFGMGIVVGVLVSPIVYVVLSAYFGWTKKAKSGNKAVEN